MAARNSVFVCYSHRNHRVMGRLWDYLKAELPDGALEPWSDLCIDVGTKWKSGIWAALRYSAAGILLVSHSFLRSEFIKHIELPTLRRRAERQGVLLLPLLLDVTKGEYTKSDLGAIEHVNRALPILHKASHNQRQAMHERICNAVSSLDLADQEEETTTPSEPMMPLLSPFFEPRSDLAEELAFSLSKFGRAGLTGIAGEGKTQEAVKWMHDYTDAYPDGIFSIAAYNEGTCMIDLGGAAVQVFPWADEPGQAENALRAFKAYLCEKTNYLVLLDNLEHSVDKLLAEFLPTNPPGDIIITSRHQDLQAIGSYQPIDLREYRLTPEAATDFLARRTGHTKLAPDEKNAAQCLAIEMDRLPLGLEQVGAYVSATPGVTFASYLADFAKYPVDVLERSRPVAGGYPDSVLVAFLLSFERIADDPRPDYQAAADVVRAGAFLAPDTVPSAMLVRGGRQLGPNVTARLDALCGQATAIPELLRPASEYSLLHVHNRGDSFDMHRLLLAVMRRRLEIDSELRMWLQRLVLCINDAWPSAEEPSEGQYGRSLLPHALSVLRNAAELSEASLDVATLAVNAGRFAERQGQNELGLRLLESGVELLRSLPDTCPGELAKALRYLGVAYDANSKYKQALPMLSEAFDILVATQGRNTPESATCLRELGLVIDHSDKPKDAIDHLREAYSIHQATLGDDAIETAISLTAVGRVLNHMERFDEAEDTLIKAVGLVRNASSGPCPELADVLNDLAKVRWKSNDLPSAVILLKEVIDVGFAVYGSEHPYYCTALNNLGYVLLAQGDLNGAEPLLIQALEVGERVLGSSSVDLTSFINNLAILYDKCERFGDAEALYRRAVDISRQCIPTHPEHARLISNLARNCRLRGAYDESRELQAEALRIWANDPGSESPSYASGLLNQAELEEAVGDWKAASRLYQQALAIRQAKLGVDHPDTQKTEALLAAIRAKLAEVP